MTASTETLDAITDSAPQALSYHSNTSTLRSTDSPKRDATELYLKSKALLESRRELEPHALYSQSVPFHLEPTDRILLLHRASHQRHRCVSKERH